MLLFVSDALVNGDRVRTGLRELQGMRHVVPVCFEGCCVCDNEGKSSMKPCVVNFFGKGFLLFFAATQVARQVQQDCTQLVCSNKEVRKRLRTADMH